MKMRCLIGGFSWDLGLDAYCPNHGSHDRWGNKRDRSVSMSHVDGPYDISDKAPYLDCCSVPAVDTEQDNVSMTKLTRIQEIEQILIIDCTDLKKLELIEDVIKTKAIDRLKAQ